MDSITLTQYEFEVFKTLCYYIYTLRHPKTEIKKLREHEKHRIIAEVSYLSEGTIRNKCSTKHAKKLTAYHFELLCTTFLETRSEFADQPDKNKNYVLFKKWVTNICKKKKWDVPFEDTQFDSTEGESHYPKAYRGAFSRAIYSIDDISFNSSSSSLSATDPSLSDRLDSYRREIPRAETSPVATSVENIITTYYEAIQNGIWKDAWNCLSNSGKNNKIWRRDFRLFKQYYRDYRHDLKFMRIFELLHISDNIFEVHTEYSYQKEYLSSELDGVSRLQIKDLNKFVEIATAFSDKLKPYARKVAASSESIYLKDLFNIEATFQLYRRFRRIGYEKIGLEDISSIERLETHQHDLCLCEYNKGKWLISNIKHDFTNEFWQIENFIK